MLYLLNKNRDLNNPLESKLFVDVKVVPSKIDYFTQHIEDLQKEMHIKENLIIELNHELNCLESPFLRGNVNKGNIRVNLYNKRFSKVEKGILPNNEMSNGLKYNRDTVRSSKTTRHPLSFDILDFNKINSSSETAHTQFRDELLNEIIPKSEHWSKNVRILNQINLIIYIYSFVTMLAMFARTNMVDITL